MARLSTRDSERVYERQLPGGGFVSIDVTPTRNLFGQRKYHGEVTVERRTELERRSGHVAPVVAEVDTSTISSVFHELLPVAQSNIAVATRCLSQNATAISATPRLR